MSRSTSSGEDFNYSNGCDSGIIPRQYWNWNRSRVTSPARALEVRTYREVQDVVRDDTRYPGPVLAVGSMHSVTDTMVNDKGTLLLMGGLSAILGLEGEGTDHVMVRAQAGCSLKTLSIWLADHGYELAYQAEIGNATLGALCTGDTKDPVQGGPGYFSAYVRQVTYVNGEGELISIDEASNPAELANFRCSFGLSGILVECLVVVNKLKLFCSRYSVHQFSGIGDLCSAIQSRIDENQAFQGNLLLPELAAGFVERSLVEEEMTQTPEMLQAAEKLRQERQQFIHQGGLGIRPSPPPLLIHYRWQLINNYDAVDVSLPRLDFSLYEHDLKKLEAVLEETVKFVRAFHELHAFKPHGWAFYAIQRTPAPAKPSGLFSGGTGTSIAMDPFYSNPLDENWHLFCRQYNRIAIDVLGASVSPIQTQWLSHGDFKIFKAAVHSRFVTPYYRNFLA